MTAGVADIFSSTGSENKLASFSLPSQKQPLALTFDPDPDTNPPTDPPSHKQLLVDPHQRACVIGFALVLNAVEVVPPLAVVPLVVVVVLHLPHRLKHAHICELQAVGHTHTHTGGDC